MKCQSNSELAGSPRNVLRRSGSGSLSKTAKVLSRKAPQWTEKTAEEQAAGSEYFLGTYWDGSMPKAKYEEFLATEPIIPGPIEFDLKIPNVSPSDEIKSEARIFKGTDSFSYSSEPGSYPTFYTKVRESLEIGSEMPVSRDFALSVAHVIDKAREISTR